MKKIIVILTVFSIQINLYCAKPFSGTKQYTAAKQSTSTAKKAGPDMSKSKLFLKRKKMRLKKLIEQLNLSKEHLARQDLQNESIPLMDFWIEELEPEVAKNMHDFSKQLEQLKLKM